MEIISSSLTAVKGQVSKLWIQKRQRPCIRKLVTSPTLLRERQISHDSFDSLTAKLVDKKKTLVQTRKLSQRTQQAMCSIVVTFWSSARNTQLNMATVSLTRTMNTKMLHYQRHKYNTKANGKLKKYYHILPRMVLYMISLYGMY